MRTASIAAIALAALLAVASAAAAPPPATAPGVPQHATYSKHEILQALEAFFGEGAEGLGEVVEKAFAEHGRPNGYVAGDEVGGAIGIGVRYGKGTLQLPGGLRRTVHWQGPSVGFDLGANAAKVFILTYRLPAADALYQRYPGVEGSLYYVGGVGVHYLQSGDTVLAPIRFGAGWRQGVSVGYMHFTRSGSLNPF